MRKAGLAYLAVIAILAAGTATGAAASVPMICPVGGEALDYTPPASEPVFGERPDGKPIGKGAYTPDLPTCPGNGLVIFQQDFSAEDKTALEKLIADPEYRALPTAATYYRAAWLMQRLGRDPQEVAAMILQASWQADGDAALKRRYQAEYIALLEPLVQGKDDDLSMALTGRVANAHRELGQFEAAGALLDALPLASLTVLVPAEERDGDDVTNGAAIGAAKAKRRLFQYLTGLKDLIAGRNAAAEPLALMPAQSAVTRCVVSATLSDDDRAYCASDDAKKRMDELQPAS